MAVVKVRTCDVCGTQMGEKKCIYITAERPQEGKLVIALSGFFEA